MRTPLFLIMMSAAICAQAQEDKVWTFGNHNGLDFNQNPPVFFQSSNESLEGCASIADATGNLLFYSNGNQVWDALGNIMPNGSGLLGNGPGMGYPASSAQGVTIVKSIADPQQYYVFVLDAAEDINIFNYPGYLRYSIVDMSLNGGLGDVIPAQKNIILDTAMSERMTVTPGVGCSYWLITHRHNSGAYRVFHIDLSGINPIPVVSNGLWQGDIGGGQLKVSSDGTKLVTASTLQGAGIELATFDKNTGLLSDFSILGGGGNVSYYGTCFSPDNSKLYVGSGNIFQYDLSLFPNAAVMEAAKIVVSTSTHAYSAMRNGPDGKIYIAIFSGHPYIARINNPNALGAACDFDANALAQPAYSLFGNSIYGHGLGGDIAILSGNDTLAHQMLDTILCSETAITLHATENFGSYIWNDGSTGPVKTVNQSGTYWVYMMDDCAVSVDSFRVTAQYFSLDLGPDTAICPGGSLILDASVPGGSYRWQDGSTDASLSIQQPGVYQVQVTVGACTRNDTIIITALDPFLAIAEGDTAFCQGETIQLHASARPASLLRWSTGSTDAAITVDQPGMYMLTAINDCGTFYDSVYIDMLNCNCEAFIPNAFSPNGDGLNDVFKTDILCSYSDFHMEIFDRWGERVFEGLSADAAWDGRQQGKPCDLGAYFYHVRYKGVRGDQLSRKGDVMLIR